MRTVKGSSPNTTIRIIKQSELRRAHSRFQTFIRFVPILILVAMTTAVVILKCIPEHSALPASGSPASEQTENKELGLVQNNPTESLAEKTEDTDKEKTENDTEKAKPEQPAASTESAKTEQKPATNPTSEKPATTATPAKPASDVRTDSPIVYLTFDDGPGAHTERLLNVLAKYNAKATFFVTNQFPKYQHLIKKIADSGHAVGIHTYTHQYKEVYSSVDAYFNDVSKMNEIIKSQTGSYSKLLRFPGGSSNTVSRFNPGIMTTLAKEVAARGFTYFDWNVPSNDTGTTNKSVIYNNVISGLRSHVNSVVLQHDIKSASVDAVEDILKFGTKNGYKFLALTETSPSAHHRINN